MKRSIKIGFNFGLTSGIITTLGLMVGLYSSTESRLVVIGGILTIAIADAFSDSMGVHVATESENSVTKKEVWESTFGTFLFKFIFTIIFIIPVLLFNLQTAIILSVIIGFILITILSISIAKERKVKPWKMVLEHVIIVTIVIVLAYYAGELIASYFG